MVKFSYDSIFAPEWLHSLPAEEQQKAFRGEAIILGGSIWQVCADCKQLVKLNKWIFGALHFCIESK